MAPRIYSAMEARQQGAQTLVATWDDVRRNMTLCLQEGRPCNLLMTADLYAESSLTVPTDLPSFSLDGGGKYILNIKGSFARWCAVNSRTHLHDVAIRLLDNSNLAQMFGVGESASLTLARCSVDASRGGITDVFGLLGTFATGLLVDGSTFNEVRNIFSADGAGKRWDRCAIRDTTFLSDIDYSPATTLGRGPTDVIFRQSEFSRINSSLAVDLGIGSHQCVFTSLPGFFGLVTNSAGVFGHTFVSCSSGGTPVLGGSDVWFGDNLILAPGSTLSVDDLAVVDDATIGGDLDVAGFTTLAGAAQVTGNLTTTGTAFSNLTRTGNGTAANPAYGFSSGNGNGAYWAALNDWRLSAGGTDNLRLTTSNTAVSTNLSVAGSASITGNLTVVGLTQFNDDTLSTKFVSWGAQTMTATGAAYVITPTSSFISVTFSSATGSLRISTTAIPTGTLLCLRVNTVTSTTATLPDSTLNGVILSAAWAPTANATLFLIFNGAQWVEISRSTN